MKLSILVLLLIFSVVAIADEKLTEAQKISIEKQLNITTNLNTIPDYAKGLLEDGNEYINVKFETVADIDKADKLRTKNSNQTSYISRCAVFKIADKGELRLLSKSAPIVRSGVGNEIFCAIKNKTVLMSAEGWNGSENTSKAFKFRLKNKNLILTGTDYYVVDKLSGSGHWIEAISSYNFLSNRVMRSIKKGEHIRVFKKSDFPVLPFRVKEPYLYKELKFNIEPYLKKTFSDFDNDIIFDWISQQKNACGKFDENLKFEACKP